MTNSITCPKCGLAQEPSSDSICRGCANPISAVPSTKSVLGLGKEPPGKPLPTGARLAGIVLLLNAAANALIMIKSGPGHDPLASHEVKGMIADLFIGGGLLFGKQTLQKWAIVRAVIGLLVFGGIYAAQSDFTSVGAQVVFSAALLLLLIGDAGKPRIVVGAAGSAVSLLLAAAGVTATYTGSNPAAAAILASKGEIVPAAGKLKGEKFGYCMNVPEKQWYLRSAEVAARDNAAADRWLTRPDLDAHVMIIGEQLAPDVEIDQRKLEQVILEEMKGRLTAFQNLGRKALRAGALLHVKGHSKDLDLEYYRGVYAHRNRAYQVVAFATPQSFARAEPELAAMINSFDPDCATAATGK